MKRVCLILGFVFLVLSGNVIGSNLNGITNAAIEVINKRGIHNGRVLVAFTRENTNGDFVTTINYISYPGSNNRHKPSGPRPEDFNSELGATAGSYDGNVTFSGINGSWTYFFEFDFVGEDNGGYGSGSSWRCVTYSTSYEQQQPESAPDE